MQRDKIETVIRRHTKKVQLLTTRAASRFAIDDIHAFRGEVKKLRAFIRMTGPVGRKLPKKLRHFYHAAGLIRNLQLFRQTLTTLRRHKHADLPAKVLEVLDQHIEAAKKGALTLIHGKKPFGKKMRRLTGGLPIRLTGSQRRAFVGRTLQVLESVDLAPLRDDQQLHAIRKALKDLLYVWPYLGNQARRLASSPFGGHAAMERDGRLLGNYMDVCVQLQFLAEKKEIFADVKPGLIRQIRREWHDQKVRLLEQIVMNFDNPRYLTPHRHKPTQPVPANPLIAGNLTLVSNELHLD
jgi:hypothetical protein